MWPILSIESLCDYAVAELVQFGGVLAHCLLISDTITKRIPTTQNFDQYEIQLCLTYV